MQTPNRGYLSQAFVLCFSLGCLLVLTTSAFAAAPQATPTTTASTVTHLTAAQLPDWLNGKQVAFVELYAPYCPACRQAGPILEKLTAELQINMAFVDISLPENHALSNQLLLEYIPTIVTYVGSEPLPGYQIGLYSEAEYRAFFQRAVATYSK